MKIYLVRHGQVDHNLYRKYNNEDEDINETGISEANNLKETIKNIDYDVVFCSPLLRTRHTCNIINVKNIPVIYDDRLKERSPGNLSGKPLDSIDRTEYWGYYSSARYGTSENIVKFVERVYAFLDELKTKDYENVLIVAHSGVSKAFYTYFNGMPNDRKHAKFRT